MIASVTGHGFRNTHTKTHQPSIDLVALKYSYDPTYLFMSTADLYPTKIATIPLDIKGKPILVPITKLNFIPQSDRKHYSDDPNKVYEFAMITLYPQKNSLKPKNTWFQQFYKDKRN